MARRQTLVQLSDELIERLDARGTRDGRSRSALVRDAVEEYLRRDSAAEIDRQIVEGYTRIPQEDIGARPGHRLRMTQRLFALRGANAVEANERDAILVATDALVREILARNALEPERIVSALFTLTPDLDAEFPAVAARHLGFGQVPLLCAREIPVPGALPRIVRTLVHYYAEPDHEPQHVYLGAAQALRADLSTAQ